MEALRSLTSSLSSCCDHSRGGSRVLSGVKDFVALAGKVTLFAVGTIALIALLGAFSAVGLTHLGLGDWSNTVLKYPIGAMIYGLDLMEDMKLSPEAPLVVLIWDRFHMFAKKEWFHTI